MYLELGIRFIHAASPSKCRFHSIVCDCGRRERWSHVGIAVIKCFSILTADRTARAAVREPRIPRCARTPRRWSSPNSPVPEMRHHSAAEDQRNLLSISHVEQGPSCSSSNHLTFEGGRRRKTWAAPRPPESSSLSKKEDQKCSAPFAPDGPWLIDRIAAINTKPHLAKNHLQQLKVRKVVERTPPSWQPAMGAEGRSSVFKFAWGGLMHSLAARGDRDSSPKNSHRKTSAAFLERTCAFSLTHGSHEIFSDI